MAADTSCLAPLGQNRYQCSKFGWTITVFPSELPIHCDCENRESVTFVVRSAIKGPGDFLHDAILKWIGEGPTRECGCTDRINQMNGWGSAGCSEHLEEIVGWMMEEAKKRGWKMATMPGAATVARLMVLRAVRQAEREAKRAATASRSSDS
jgi:hypothetical protein